MEGMPTLPGIGAIQRTNVIVACLAVLLLLVFRSTAAAMSCFLGAGVVIANLFLLALLVRVLLASANGGAGGGALGAIALPLKLILIAGVVYVALYHSGVDGVGFAVGVFTQLVAVLIETARSNLKQQRVSPEGI